MTPKFFDVHSHIQFPDFDKDRFSVIERMKNEGVAALVVGTNAEYSAEAVEATTLWPEGLSATIGMHPTETVMTPIDTAHFRSLLQNKKVVGIGECGLDYFRRSKESGEIKRQKELLETQVALAAEYNLPLMLHCRPSKGTTDAYDDVLSLLSLFAKTHGEKVRGNAHFFVGTIEVARKFFDLGFTISFPGVITFARDYDEVVKYAPLENVLSETDCPFVSPEPYRGKRNEPVYVKEVVEKIAKIRKEDEERVKKQLVENARRVFGSRR